MLRFNINSTCGYEYIKEFHWYFINQNCRIVITDNINNKYAFIFINNKYYIHSYNVHNKSWPQHIWLTDMTTRTKNHTTPSSITCKSHAISIKNFFFTIQTKNIWMWFSVHVDVSSLKSWSFYCIVKTSFYLTQSCWCKNILY